MPQTEWRLKGDWIKNCNCAFGCPCDFNARPTHGNCQGLVGMRVESGHFGDTSLDGLSFFVMVDFPGPLHEGNGTIQAIIDQQSTAEQRDGFFQILSGKHAAEGTLFHIFSLIVSKMLDPIFAPIDFEFDMEGRTARVYSGCPGDGNQANPQPGDRSGASHSSGNAGGSSNYHKAEIARACIASTGGYQRVRRA
jgi:hypothetical protein